MAPLEQGKSMMYTVLGVSIFIFHPMLNEKEGLGAREYARMCTYEQLNITCYFNPYEYLRGNNTVDHCIATCLEGELTC